MELLTFGLKNIGTINALIGTYGTIKNTFGIDAGKILNYFQKRPYNPYQQNNPYQQMNPFHQYANNNPYNYPQRPQYYPRPRPRPVQSYFHPYNSPYQNQFFRYY